MSKFKDWPIIQTIFTKYLSGMYLLEPRMQKKNSSFPEMNIELNQNVRKSSIKWTREYQVEAYKFDLLQTHFESILYSF